METDFSGAVFRVDARTHSLDAILLLSRQWFNDFWLNCLWPTLACATVLQLNAVRDVAFLRPQSSRRSEGCCTSLDTEFSNRQRAYDPGRTPQEETILGRDAAG